MSTLIGLCTANYSAGPVSPADLAGAEPAYHGYVRQPFKGYGTDYDFSMPDPPVVGHRLYQFTSKDFTDQGDPVIDPETGTTFFKWLPEPCPTCNQAWLFGALLFELGEPPRMLRFNCARGLNGGDVLTVRVAQPAFSEA